ncbi:MAG: hypothetical protein PHX44_04045 [Sulfurimonas sp.]|uniref:hypothetical protein n=1 Tax=Sulfurimonas sp. TaxID=2022749 RepID=UPI00260B52E9|nr:hypothetical protein [Sulfurimonas sp.]MDD2652203.1 hypothetical protein [Sulfurimonas sp.]MDD3450515.1 hypothetical protein [Sulfurimonas sp.]
MKIVLLFIIPITIFAFGERMSVMDALYFDKAKKQPFISKPHYKERMYRLSRIKNAKEIVKTLTQEDTESLVLTTQGNYLVYKASTQHYTLLINALDGTVIKKEDR